MGESVGRTVGALVVPSLVVLVAFASGEELVVAEVWVWQGGSASLEKADAEALERTVSREEQDERGEREAE